MSWWKGASDLLNLDKASALVDKAKASSFMEKARTLAQDAAEAANKVTETVQEEYRKTFVELDCKIVFVRPALAVMEVPNYDNIARLSTRINTDHGDRAKILDASSSAKYDAGQFQAEAIRLPPGPPAGLPGPPLEKLMETLLVAHGWLQADSRNVVIVHSSEDFVQAALFLACLMAFRGEHAGSPEASLREIHEHLAISQPAAPSLLRYLGYVRRCLSDFTPVPTSLRLAAVKLNTVPVFDDKGSVAFRPLVEVYGARGLVAQSATPLPELLAIDSSADLRLPDGAVVSGDVVVTISHVSADGAQKELAASFALHSSFLSPGATLRLPRSELDVACQEKRFADDAVAELVVQAASDAAAEAKPQAVFVRAQDTSRRFVEETRRRQEAEKADDDADALERPEEVDDDEWFARFWRAFGDYFEWWDDDWSFWSTPEWNEPSNVLAAPPLPGLGGKELIPAGLRKQLK
eukprot:TRINITY_DN13753_c0_g2_i1.p1 TRINITY_DN13753_c0_g2~~TRINITY_DN13753_c0_g2_i1.p1  ORF type:complete len:488 (+),score=125.24 TRINITY_DN13753_c0_g2_i1:69-1466(+)